MTGKAGNEVALGVKQITISTGNSKHKLQCMLCSAEPDRNFVHAAQGCSCDRNLLQQAAQRGVGNNAIRISALLALPPHLQSKYFTSIFEIMSKLLIVDTGYEGHTSAHCYRDCKLMEWCLHACSCQGHSVLKVHIQPVWGWHWIRRLLMKFLSPILSAVRQEVKGKLSESQC